LLWSPVRHSSWHKPEGKPNASRQGTQRWPSHGWRHYIREVDDEQHWLKARVGELTHPMLDAFDNAARS